MAATTNPFLEAVRQAEHDDLRLAVLELIRASANVAQAVEEMAEHHLAHGDNEALKRYGSVLQKLSQAQKHLLASLSAFPDASDEQH